MKIDYSVKYDGLKLGNLSTEAMQQILNKTMNAMRTEAIHQLSVNDTNDTGDLRQRIQLVEETPNKFILESLAPQSEDIEFGTEPHYVDPEELKEWAGRKLGDQALAIPVSKKIRAKGTKAQPFFRPAYDYGTTVAFKQIAKRYKSQL